MIARIVPRPTPERAAAILREVFGRIQAPVAFRLWDGSEVRLAGDGPAHEAAARQRRVAHDGDPLPLAERHDVLLDVAIGQAAYL